ncbi:MAG: hypothetical protein FJX57_03365 [Alphaproteobacteria bacterium]|nr:hypothetical protein [Alphaproteobacteria bacterium]
MKLHCPNCQTAFSVPDQALQPAGRTVRCSRCTHVWFSGPDGRPAAPPVPVAVSSPSPAPQPAPVSPPAVPPQLPSVVTARPAAETALAPATKKRASGRRARLGAILGWGGLVVVVLGLAAALYFHEVVAAEIPASRPFYRFTKLMPLQAASKPGGDKSDSAPSGLSLHGLRFRTTSEPDLAQFHGRELPPAVVVTVTIVNESWRPRSIRTLRGSTVDAKGKVLTAWTPKLARPWLWPGESSSFKSDVSLAGERPAEIQFNLLPLE